MTTDVAQRDPAVLVEKVLLSGDLAALTPRERIAHYRSVCDSLGLNPLTKPFEYITLNNKLTLYALKTATDQLRTKHEVSIPTMDVSTALEGVYVVTAHAVDKSGRQDSAIGAVTISGLKGEALANAIMKAETKAKRRVTLSICGLGWLDESEAVDTTGYTVSVNDDGEIEERVPPPRQEPRRDRYATGPKSTSPEEVAKRTQPEGRQRIDGMIVGVGGTPQEPTITVEKQGKRLTFRVSPDVDPVTVDHLEWDMEGIVVKDDRGYVVVEVSHLAPNSSHA